MITVSLYIICKNLHSECNRVNFTLLFSRIILRSNTVIIFLSMGTKFCEFNNFDLDESSLPNHKLSYYMDDLRFYGLFNSISVISHDGRIILKGCVQWNLS